MTNLGSMPSWKHCALLFILLSHAVLGSPVVTFNNEYITDGPSSQLLLQGDSYLLNQDGVVLHDDNSYSSISENKRRQKRTLYETFKKAKRIKLLSLGEASSSAAKSVGKSLLKTVATLGIKAIIFNFLYTKINQVLDFKNRLLTNLEHKNREQNSQVLGIGDTASAGSEKSTAGSSTDSPADDVPEFNPEKISLALPGPLFSSSFSLANGISQVIGTLVQNKARRLARLFESLKPFLQSSAGVKSKKRETEDKLVDGNSSGDKENSAEEESPVKTSYTALTQER